MAAVATTTSAEGSVLQVFLFPSGATAGPDASDVYGSVLGSVSPTEFPADRSFGSYGRDLEGILTASRRRTMQ
jgi:hypothetical protein